MTKIWTQSYLTQKAGTQSPCPHIRLRSASCTTQSGMPERVRRHRRHCLFPTVRLQVRLLSCVCSYGIRNQFGLACLRQDISDVHPYLCQTTWLSSFQVFSCLHSHLAVGTLRLQTCTTAPSFPWVLGTQNNPWAIFPALFLLPVHTPPPAQSRAFHNS